MRSFHSLLLILVGCVQQLRPQLLDWIARTRWSVRALLFLAALACTGAFGSVFTQLPNGWFDTMFANLFTVSGAFVAVVVTMFFVASAGMGVLTEKVRQTL